MKIILSNLYQLKLLLLTFYFFTGVDAFGQSKSEKKQIIAEYDQAKLAALQQELEAKYLVQKKEAIEFAKQKGIPLKIQLENGENAELQRFSKEGNPIYFQNFNAGAALTTRANTLNTGGSLGLDINGQGMTVGVWDQAHLLLAHDAFEGRATQIDNPGSCSNHATHVAGTMVAGLGASGGNARGMAYEANVLGHDWNLDVSEATTQAMTGLLLSNHSYGFRASDIPIHWFGKYLNDAHDWDNLMYNAPYYQMVNAAGNDRNNSGPFNTEGGYDLLSGHATSKNAIVVCAVNEVTNYQQPSDVVMSSFSSWGPTDDGRIKPDISGKGVNVLSALCNGGYGSMNGTSMASPNVTGTLLLLQQLYNQEHGEFMYASMLRGLAIHTADEAGNADGPDYEFGWGLLNAEKAGQLILDNRETTRLESHILKDNATYTTALTTDGNAPLEVTICWTDPAGNIVTSSDIDLFEIALVNDLDLRIMKDGEVYMPWKLDPANPSAPAFKGDNIVDNVEKVSIKNPDPGNYTISVTHKGSLTNENQRFALIISGATSFEPVTIAAFDYDKSEGTCPSSGVEVRYTNRSQIIFSGPTDEITGYHWTFEGGQPETSTEANPTVSYAEIGPFDVTLIVESTLGNDTLKRENLIKIADPIPTLERFDSHVRSDWELGHGWSFTTNGLGNNSGSIWINNFEVSHNEVDFTTFFYNTREYDSLRISFDIAYAYFSSQVTDSLRISLQGCNNSKTVWQQGGFDLASVSPKTSLFIPTSEADWKNYIIELDASDLDFTKLVFTNIGGNANAMYIDNIHVEGYSQTVNLELGDDVTACNSTTLDAGVADADSYSWNEVGNSTVLGTTQTLDVTASGTYEVTVSKFGKTETDQVTVTINNPATASFTYSLSDDLLTATFTNSSMNATNGYEWDFGDGNSSTAEAPTHTYAAYGNYTVTLTAKADCGDDTQSTFLTEVTSLDVDGLLSQQMLVYPNPNSGSFILDIPNVNVNKAQIQVLDITGRKIWEQHVNNLSKQNIQLHNIEAGVYFIRLEVDGKVGIRKVQVN